MFIKCRCQATCFDPTLSQLSLSLYRATMHAHVATLYMSIIISIGKKKQFITEQTVCHCNWPLVAHKGHAPTEHSNEAFTSTHGHKYSVHSAVATTPQSPHLTSLHHVLGKTPQAVGLGGGSMRGAIGRANCGRGSGRAMGGRGSGKVFTMA